MTYQQGFAFVCAIVAMSSALSLPALGSVCRSAGGGVGRVVLELDGRGYEYRLVARDAKWTVDSFGHHATAAIWCEGCEQAVVQGGFVWMQAGNGTAGFMPTKEDDDRFVEYVSSMWFSGYRGSKPEPIGDMETLQWSGLETYVRRYYGRSAQGKDAEILVLVARDDCMILRMYTAVHAPLRMSAPEVLGEYLKGLEVQTKPVELRRK